MNRQDFEGLEVGTKILHWAGGPVYVIIRNDDGKITAAQYAQIEIIGKDKHHEHYPWDVYMDEKKKGVE